MTDWNAKPAPLTTADIEVGRKHSVYREWVHDWSGAHMGWSPNGMAASGRFGGHQTHAVRVLAFDGATGYVFAANGRGQVERIPARSFGPEIPDVDYLPGTSLLVDGKAVTVKDACDDIDGAQIYFVQTRSNRDVVMIKRDGVWRYGKASRPVEVRRA